MIPASRQRNYLQSALYVVVAGILAAILLERLLTYAEAYEKAQMEVTLSRLHSGLYARLAYLALRGEYEAVDAMRTRSPFAVLSWQPPAYQGELEPSGPSLEGGRWGFDATRGQLVYAPRLTRHLAGGERAQGEVYLRFRVVLAQPSRYRYTGVAIQPVQSYQWDPG